MFLERGRCKVLCVFLLKLSGASPQLRWELCGSLNEFRRGRIWNEVSWNLVIVSNALSEERCEIALSTDGELLARHL